MKQLSLLGDTTINDTGVPDLSIFDRDIIIQKEEKEPVLEIQKNITLKYKHYVRTSSNETFCIDEYARPQRVFVGYERKYTRDKKAYKKRIYEERQRAFCYLIEDGKTRKEYLCIEDIVAQSPFLIDLIFKGDFIHTRDYGVVEVIRKKNRKVIIQECFEIEEHSGRTRKVKKAASTSFLICETKKGNQIVVSDYEIISLRRKIKFDYARYLEKDMKIRTKHYGWCTIIDIWHNKARCICEGVEIPFFVYFTQILDTKVD